MIKPVNVLISDIKVKDRVRKDVGALKELQESIAEFGLINPITLNEKAQARIKPFKEQTKLIEARK